MSKNQNNREVVGLIPAAGKASRIAPLPCSKELYPIGFRSIDTNGSMRPKVVSHYLLEKMRLANIKKAFIILREGKWDIPSYFRDGKMIDMHLAYLMMDRSYGVPYTLEQAYPFIQHSLVALGFPDILIQPEDAYVKLLVKLEESNADIVLGLSPANQPQKTDMVELDDHGRICEIYIKSNNSHLEYAWEIAVWTPAFTEYMHNYVISHSEAYKQKKQMTKNQQSAELYVGDVIRSAIKDNIRIDSVLFKEGSSIDIGTPEDLIKAIHITDRRPEDIRK